MSSPVNPQVRLNVIRSANFSCYFCGTGGSRNNFLTVDHINPKASGGTNKRDNLVCACKKCNTKKGNMSLKKFVKRYKIKIPKSSAICRTEKSTYDSFEYLVIGSFVTVANFVMMILIHT